MINEMIIDFLRRIGTFVVIDQGEDIAKGFGVTLN